MHQLARIHRMLADIAANAAGSTLNVVTTSSNTYVAAVGDYIRVRTVTDGEVTIELPPVTAANKGKAVELKDIQANAAANNITWDPAGADTVDGAPTQPVTVNRAAARVVSDGVSEWMAS